MKRGAGFQPTRVWGKNRQSWRERPCQELNLNRTKRCLEGSIVKDDPETMRRVPGLEQSLHKPLTVHWRDPERHLEDVQSGCHRSHRIALHRTSFPHLNQAGPDLEQKISIMMVCEWDDTRTVWFPYVMIELRTRIRMGMTLASKPGEGDREQWGRLHNVYFLRSRIVMYIFPDAAKTRRIVTAYRSPETNCLTLAKGC